MGKYNYDKKALKGLTPFPFLGEVKTRNAKIEEAPDTIPTSIYNPNRLASSLHPGVQFAKVTKTVDQPDATMFVLSPDADKGTKSLAYFRAGQYISILLNMNGVVACKPYTLCSAPRDALGEADTSYAITVKHTKDGQASEYILQNWKVGTKVMMSGPLGNFYYQELRDAKTVVALAGGSGITPFYSMACAVADGTEDFNLTILYGSRTHDSILLKSELDAVVERSGGKVKVVYVLSDELLPGYENGLITAEMVAEYAVADDYSIFVCGPKAMYAYLKTELAKLSLPDRRIRFEVSGEYGDPTKDAAYPAEFADKIFAVTVHMRDKVFHLTCPAATSLLRAMEAAGIPAPSDCRSGQCGWCHSKLLKGDVFIPEDADGRRAADKKFGWIHPCCSYPLSDIELDVPPIH